MKNIEKLIKELVNEVWINWEEGKELCSVCGGDAWQHFHMNGKVLWCQGSKQAEERDEKERRSQGYHPVTGWPTKEGYGYVHDKDMKKDPKHIKGHRWTIKWNEEAMKKEALKQTIRECISDVIKEYNEDEEIKLIQQIVDISQSGKGNSDVALSKISQIAERILDMHKEDPQPSMDVPIKEYTEESELKIAEKIKKIADAAINKPDPSIRYQSFRAIEQLSNTLLKMHRQEPHTHGDIKLKESDGPEALQALLKDTKGWRCPSCKLFMHLGRGDKSHPQGLRVLNPSNPTIYQCGRCGLKWNPDNIASRVNAQNQIVK